MIFVIDYDYHYHYHWMEGYIWMVTRLIERSRGNDKVMYPSDFDFDSCFYVMDE